MRRLVIATMLALVAQEASAQCAGTHVNFFWQHNCIPCRDVKAFLDQHRVRYEPHNIEHRNVQDYMRQYIGIIASPIVESKGQHVEGYKEGDLRHLLCLSR